MRFRGWWGENRDREIILCEWDAGCGRDVSHWITWMAEMRGSGEKRTKKKRRVPNRFITILYFHLPSKFLIDWRKKKDGIFFNTIVWWSDSRIREKNEKWSGFFYHKKWKGLRSHQNTTWTMTLILLGREYNVRKSAINFNSYYLKILTEYLFLIQRKCIYWKNW